MNIRSCTKLKEHMYENFKTAWVHQTHVTYIIRRERKRAYHKHTIYDTNLGLTFLEHMAKVSVVVSRWKMNTFYHLSRKIEWRSFYLFTTKVILQFDTWKLACFHINMIKISLGVFAVYILSQLIYIRMINIYLTKSSLSTNILEWFVILARFFFMQTNSSPLKRSFMKRCKVRKLIFLFQGSHWKEALRILKMAVTRSSSLVVPPASSHTHYWDHHVFADIESHFKKELPGSSEI